MAGLLDSEVGGGGARLATPLAVGLAALLSAVDAWRSLTLSGFRYVDEDVAIYWFAAQEFAHLRFREPFFYGQAYNHLGESLLAAPLVAAGASVWTATAVVSLCVGLASWLILARLAWRRRAQGLAVLLLGAPALMPAGYQMLLTRFFGMGILAATAALLVADELRHRWRWIPVGFLLAIGVGLVPNTGPLAVTGLAWLACTSLRGGLAWTLTGLGAAAGAALIGLGRLFYVLNPGWSLHPSPTLDFELALVGDGLRHLPRHLARVTPSVLLHPAVLLVALLIVTALALRRRSAAGFWPAGMILLVVVAAFALTKVHEGTRSVFFAYERMFLGLPLAVGAVALSALDGKLWRGLDSSRSALACAALLLALAVPKQVTLASEVARERATPQTVLAQADVQDMLAVCAQVEAGARVAETDLAIFLLDRTRAYACGALSYGTVTTLFPEYERRTWLLEEEARRTRGSVLLVDVDPGPACSHVAGRVPGAGCFPLGPEMVGVRYGPGSALELVRALGIPVRQF